jgi:hypothetical protein
MPNFRLSFVPHPITGMPAAVVRDYLLGKNPVTGKPVLDEVIAGLTGPLTAEDQATGLVERPIPRLVDVTDTEEKLTQYFHDNGWTDGLPIVLPTEERVAAMLKGTSHKRDELVGTMQPSSPHEAWSYTVEKVAVNAVMAGARPEHFPVILALAASGVTSLFTSTTSFARMGVINGPIQTQLNMNAGIGALGPFNQANSIIGRAWTLLSMNLSGSGRIGQTYMGSQGNNFNYNNLLFPENEAQLPEGWNPLHVQLGYKPEESVVSVFTGWGFIHADQSFSKEFHTQIPHWLQFISPFSSATLLLDPTIVKQLKNYEGFDSKEQLRDWIFENTKLTAREWREDYYSVQNFVLPVGRQGTEPYASWMKLPDDAMVPRISRPARITIIAVGGETNLFWQPGDFGLTTSVSIDKWR